MTAKIKREDDSKVKEVTFRCKYCEKSRPLSEMVVLTTFFPPVIACQDCEKKIR